MQNYDELLRKQQQLLEENPLADWSNDVWNTSLKEIMATAPSEILEVQQEIKADYLASVLEYDWSHPYQKEKITESLHGDYFQYAWTDDTDIVREKVDNNIIEIWNRRVSEIQNPLLKTKYLNLIFDFSDSTDISIINDIVHETIAYIEADIVEEKELSYFRNWNVFYRSFFLAAKTKNKGLKDLIMVLFHYEKKHRDLVKHGTWGIVHTFICHFSYIEKQFPSISEKVNDDMREIFDVSIEKKNRDRAWSSFQLLLKKSTSNETKALFQDLYPVLLEKDPHAPLEEKFIKDVLKVIHVSWFLPGQKQDLIKRIQDNSADVLESLTWQKYRTDVSITDEQLQKIKNSILLNGNNEKNTDEEVIQHFIGASLLSLFNVVGVRSDTQSIARLFCSTMKINQDGINIGLVGFGVGTDGYSEKEKEEVIESIGMNLEGNVYFETLIKNIKREALSHFFQSCGVYKSRAEYIERGISYLFAGDYFAAMNIFLPVIEEVLRMFLMFHKVIDAPYDTVNGRIKYFDLNKILAKAVFQDRCNAYSEEIKSHLKEGQKEKVPDNLLFLFYKLMLSDNIGHNLRNNLAHGINTDYLDRVDLLGQVLLLLMSVPYLFDHDTINDLEDISVEQRVITSRPIPVISEESQKSMSSHIIFSESGEKHEGKKIIGNFSQKVRSWLPRDFSEDGEENKRNILGVVQDQRSFDVIAEVMEQNMEEGSYNKYLETHDIYKSRLDYVKKGCAYLQQGDYLMATQVFLPFIENVFRESVKDDTVIIEENKKTTGGMKYITLEKILNNDVFKERYEGKESVLYLYKILLTREGLNLRNDFAHCVNVEQFDDKRIAYWLLFIVLEIAEPFDISPQTT
ncbi:hypothetical protein COB57_05820 [Candidatus Peregrinibacteria bacterium]|nr:MAG: hypothetical protein COB57_05820 [Candidatus Peregrinibacteria bacterium]